MNRLIQISAGLALAGWAAITLSYSFDAFIAPVPAFRYKSQATLPDPEATYVGAR